ncbi:MAG: hypothetical protein WC621_01855 [Patescibacteria group bacterium]
MATPTQTPAKQKRFLHGYSEMINLGEKESLLMNDMCIFIKMEADKICCVDQVNKKVHLLVKNKNVLFIKKQTLCLKAEKFK